MFMTRHGGGNSYGNKPPHAAPLAKESEHCATLEIRPGYTFNVGVTKDVVFQRAYSTLSVLSFFKNHRIEQAFFKYFCKVTTCIGYQMDKHCLGCFINVIHNAVRLDLNLPI